MKNKYFPILILVTVIFLVYKPILSGFFQQDEWLTFGNLFSSSNNAVNIFLKLLSLQLAIIFL